MSTIGKGRRIAGWVLTGLLTALFLGSAAGKLAGAADVVKMMGEWGLGKFVLLIGVGELISALLFAIPKTHSLGVLLLSGYMGGAIVTHMQHNESFVGQSIILAVIWITGFLRYPELLQSFRSSAPASSTS